MDDFFKEVKAAFPIYPIPSFDLVYGYKISSEESYEDLILLEGKEYMNKKDVVLVADSAALALEKFNDYSIYTNSQLDVLIKWAYILNFEIQ